jgi:hypothetical protein
MGIPILSSGLIKELPQTALRTISSFDLSALIVTRLKSSGGC